MSAELYSLIGPVIVQREERGTRGSKRALGVTAMFCCFETALMFSLRTNKCSGCLFPSTESITVLYNHPTKPVHQNVQAVIEMWAAIEWDDLIAASSGSRVRHCSLCFSWDVSFPAISHSCTFQVIELNPKTDKLTLTHVRSCWNKKKCALTLFDHIPGQHSDHVHKKRIDSYFMPKSAKISTSCH